MMNNTAPTKVRPGYAVVNISRSIVFAVVEVIAAIQLGGWIGVALWLMAAYTTVFVLIAVWGLAMLATKEVERQQALDKTDAPV